jgi:hypothetical protein
MCRCSTKPVRTWYMTEYADSEDYADPKYTETDRVVFATFDARNIAHADDVIIETDAPITVRIWAAHGSITAYDTFSVKPNEGLIKRVDVLQAAYNALVAKHTLDEVEDCDWYACKLEQYSNMVFELR